MNHSKMFLAKNGGGGRSFQDKYEEKTKLESQNRKVKIKISKAKEALRTLEDILPKLKLQVESANAHMTNGATSIASTYGDSVYSYAGVIAEKADALSYAYTAHYIDLDSDINQISAKITELKNKIESLENEIVPIDPSLYDLI